MASNNLSILDKKLLGYAANGYTPEQIAEETYVPAEQAIARIKELLASNDIWDEVEQRRLAVYSLQQLKSQVERVGVDVTNPKAIEAYTKLVAMIDRVESKTKAISDNELERLAIMQAQRLVQLFEMAYGRARQLLADEYPDIDLGRIDDAIQDGLREFSGQMNAQIEA